MFGQILGFGLLAALAVVGVLAWRRSWHRCRLQIRALPERTHPHPDKETHR
ncbi:MAG: hypothetical protein ACRDNK_23065 [Solirubrobacteraceae bacterium]